MNKLAANAYAAPADVSKAGRPSVVLPTITFLSIIAGSLLLFLLLVAGPFAWLLRDGLGPDSTTSTWTNALMRLFWTFYWGPATVFTGTALMILLFLRRRLIRSTRQASLNPPETPA